MEPVAITGLGIISNHGVGTDVLWEGLCAGRLRGDPTTASDLAGYLDEAQRRAYDRVSQLAVTASSLAFVDAGTPKHREARVGVCLGNTFGCLGAQVELDRCVLKNGPGDVRGSLFPYAAFNAAAGNVAIAFRAMAANLTLATGVAAGLDACAEGARQVAYGYADCMLAGGVESLNEDVLMELEKLGWVEPSAAPASPYDPASAQVAPREGASVMLLETTHGAARRGARVYGVIAGLGEQTADEPTRASYAAAAESALRTALLEAGVAPEDVRWVAGSGAGLPRVDEAELDALESVFASRDRPVWLCSVKQMVGETLSAGGAIQVAAALLSLRHGLVPPMGAEARPRAHVAFAARPRPFDPGPVACLSLSREGIATCLIVRPRASQENAP